MQPICVDRGARSLGEERLKKIGIGRNICSNGSFIGDAQASPPRQEVWIERRERNDHDDGENCEIRPKPGMATVPAAANNAAASAATNKPALR